MYGLEIKEEFKELRSYAYQSKDYQVNNDQQVLNKQLLYLQITPGSPWNYAIHLTDDNNPSSDLKFQYVGWKEGVIPFSNDGAPSKIQATVLNITNYFLLISVFYRVVFLIHGV